MKISRSIGRLEFAGFDHCCRRIMFQRLRCEQWSRLTDLKCDLNCDLPWSAKKLKQWIVLDNRLSFCLQKLGWRLHYNYWLQKHFLEFHIFWNCIKVQSNEVLSLAEKFYLECRKAIWKTARKKLWRRHKIKFHTFVIYIRIMSQ